MRVASKRGMLMVFLSSLLQNLNSATICEAPSKEEVARNEHTLEMTRWTLILIAYPGRGSYPHLQIRKRKCGQ